MEVSHNGKKQYGGSFTNEHAAAQAADDMRVSFGLHRVNAHLLPHNAAELLQSERDTKAAATSSQYNNVSYNKAKKKYLVQVYHNGQLQYGGCFKNEHAAAQAADDLRVSFGLERVNAHLLPHNAAELVQS